MAYGSLGLKNAWFR